ncbi:MAG: hypothetical protein DMG76_23740 [Acidobacteria bacterium]|nr:MAG: hypothetical protein DMG76_23740 [Acidobacteriota bacterium]
MTDDAPLCIFYPGGDGDLKIIAWDAITHRQTVGWLGVSDAKLVFDYIYAAHLPSKEALVMARNAALIENGLLQSKR